MTIARKKMKILWALDPFDDLDEIYTKSFQALNSLSNYVQLEVDPVYLLSPLQLNIDFNLTTVNSEVYISAAKKALEKKLEGIPLSELNDPKVLVNSSSRLRQVVQELADQALSREYDMILVGSHGRKGLNRMMMGSFAEQLLLQSKVPVFIIGNETEKLNTRWNQKPIHILIANDLSNPSSSFFSKALGLAQSLEAKITLLRAVTRPAEMVLQSGVYLLSGGFIPTPIFMRQEDERLKNAANIILHEAEKQHIQTEMILDNNAQSVVQSILSHAKESNASFIVMAAESGQVASTLLGSITRQVVRLAPCPVLVYRVDKK
ncbi:MAG: universal stress protein [Xanthomonadaceae bacterium]|nr:universal stress protein [Xanthomonadaceae bacterium]